MKQTLLTLSWLFILFLFTLMLYGIAAHASTHWQLSLYDFPAAYGHTLDDKSYLEKWRLDGGDSHAECVRRGNLALKFRESGLVDNSPTIGTFRCDPLPESVD